jgi:hypothetical protein
MMSGMGPGCVKTRLTRTSPPETVRSASTGNFLPLWGHSRRSQPVLPAISCPSFRVREQSGRFQVKADHSAAKYDGADSQADARYI